MYRRFLQLAMLMAIAVLIAACGGAKQAKKDLLYLQQGTLDTIPNLNVPLKEGHIQKDDILSIVVYSDNPEATAIYNQPSTGGGAKTSSGDQTTMSKTAGYLVDQRGNIRFQTIGLLHVEGMTRAELMDTLSKKLTVYLTNPFVDVRFMNNRITVIGEVSRPGVFSLPNEKVNILEIIGMAGDITIYGRKDKVLIIREENGKRTFGTLDLRRTDIFQSPYFYLQQNDMVLVEPTSKKPTATEQEQMRKLTMITAFATLVSTLSILITLFK
ncbi:polysaccharide biosynthesis/export family protein [Flavihumibacter profundi]|uniref:polysaccharide biosynthesis/export family protein n=1 Tax=Flavihumibacter profundi TaxID=2716883 RepID=UPI001CC6D467|nr:polysaccharide biosynthesis/export family protein [Flavihumibacter profundi]MBZ5857983.1 polysaccharide biosynthesis/export family protein [Flavihumibacter profundi]